MIQRCFLVFILATLLCGLNGAPSSQSPKTPINALSIKGRGATVPFFEIEAEAADHNGEVIGPDRTYHSLPAEASGRTAVTLSPGQYVEFTLTDRANAMMVRFSIPDSSDGTEYLSPLSVFLNGEQKDDLTLTNKYSHQYGAYTCCPPIQFSNDPGLGNPEHFYDTVLRKFDTLLESGSKVRLQVPDGAASVTIDVADFEVVGDPIGQPSGSLNVVTDFQADPTGQADSKDAIQAAVDAGRDQGKVVYIPEGTYKVTDHVIVDRVTLRGAGPWYSILTGGNHDAQPDPTGVGIYGKYSGDGGSSNVVLSDFSIIGEVDERRDRSQINGIGGAYSDSYISNLFIQHAKCGAWLDGPMNNITIDSVRIMDTFADGVNFHYGITNSKVINSFIRNTGDDGLAMWADTIANKNNFFTGNTVLHPILANNIAIYGGTDITVTDNVVADNLSNGGGLHVANRYNNVDSGQGTAVAGTFTIARNTVIRGGNTDYNWQFPVGAVWFDALNGPLTGANIQVTDSDILDTSYSAIHFVEGQIEGVEFNNITVDGTGTFVLQVQTSGSALFSNVRASGVGYTDNAIYSCLGTTGFLMNQGEGNSGWIENLPNVYCGQFPPPNYNH